MSPLHAAVVACAGLAALCWLLSLLTREYSWVDRVWSLAPIGYVAWFAAQTDPADPRLMLMAGLVALWGVRLTFNFARKGGYRRGGEDYRWSVLRGMMPPPLFQAFNLVFIAAYQNALLLLISLPAWAALREPPTPLGALDGAATAAFLLLLVGETVADQQQWAFQLAKRRRGGAGPGFVTTGLFRWSRHPNFFCEQGMWWCFYLFSVAAGADWINPTIVGPVLLTLLFLGSTTFTESISAARYPAYRDYQRRTSRLIPWWPAAPREASR